MTNFKIKWSFVSPISACKTIEGLGARSLTIINFYANNKKVDRYSKMVCFEPNVATLEAKKYIRKFFRKNEGLRPHCEFIRTQKNNIN